MHAVAHRHAEAHFGDVHYTGDHDGVAIDDDGRVVTLDFAARLPGAPAKFKPTLASTIPLLPPPPVPVVHGTRDDVEHLIHGPPLLAVGLRAPPSVSHL